ncbi:MAG: ABC transporter ATP-binding protein, partial [Ignavibacteriaceae bacterium]|nr:ABC transporter ATP-binding protein [Ignavibacteriaceae bacterium]
VANRMIIINKGSKIVEGEVSELLNSSTLKVTIEVDDTAAVIKILEGTRWNRIIESITENKFVISIEQSAIPVLNKYLVENGVMVNAIIPVRSLEDYFLTITSGAK